MDRPGPLKVSGSGVRTRTWRRPRAPWAWRPRRLPALRRGDRGRGAGQRVTAGGRLREGDDVADGVVPAEQRDDPVEAEGDATVRRRAVVEGVQQEAELRGRLLLGEADRVERPLLHLALVDTDRTAAQLRAVEDQVVGVGQGRARVGVEGGQRLGGRGGERVVHRVPALELALVVLDRLEHREVDDPEEGPLRLVDQLAAAADLQAGGAQQLLRGALLAGREEDRVAVLGTAAAARPARCSAERFLATGPRSSPVSASMTT